MNKLLLSTILISTLTYANSCPKWAPLPIGDIMTVIPIYDESITGPDMDCDKILDSVDSDIDGDGVANTFDAFPTNSSETLDTDTDGIGNNADNDDDNDGLSDTEEIKNGTNPLNADTDGDGINDKDDSRPNDVDKAYKISGVIGNVQYPDKTTVILGNDSFLREVKIQSNGSYEIANIPAGKYFLKVQTIGQKSGGEKWIVIGGSNTVINTNFTLNNIASDSFTYHWEEDISRSGYQYTSYVNEQPTIEFLGEEVDRVDLAAADKLKHDYNIVLSDENALWNEENVYRLLETLKSIPQSKRSSQSKQTLKMSKWILTSDFVEDDIKIQKNEKGNTITISTAAFTYASPKMVRLNGVKGKFFSQKLHHALVNYVTDYGKDASAVKRILEERFGVTTRIPSYTKLTASTTGEDENSFQAFHPDELVSIINMFEEMPSGYHKIKGFKYLVRRVDGMPNPVHPKAPAIAWSNGYIEFMDTAFISNVAHMNRLIIHEKTHFLWSNVFSEQLKQDWMEVGGWYKNSDDADGWSTTKTTEFVSAYAHLKNPNEDMSESVSYYILNPDKLKTRSLPKYEFIRDRIMSGDLYISKIREDLTFEVLNLFPDYNYPGKIKRVDIEVSGEAEEDKRVTVEIELHVVDKLFDGASRAITRVTSEIGTYVDLHLRPVDGNPAVLRGSFNLSKYAKSGLWFANQIVVTDRVGNQRFEGVSDFGWKMFINNPLEDIIKPKYVKDSLKLNLRDAVKDGRDVQILNVSYEVDENQNMKKHSPGLASLTNPESGAYRVQRHGSYNEDTKRISIDFTITEYYASGRYGIPFISFKDLALNQGGQSFSDSEKHEPLVTINIETANPDLTPPEVDLNQITVDAEPTNPSAPNGETKVKITYVAKDDKAGLGLVSYRLLDPEGKSHREFHYHENFYTTFFKGDATAWKKYEINVVLPKGSAPGIWGLQALEVFDKASNKKSYNFVETMHFEVIK